jgi:hypothetical protein
VTRRPNPQHRRGVDILRRIPVTSATVLDLGSSPVVVVVLMILGLACIVLGFLLAFTLYGIAALVVGAGCVGTGMVLLLVRYGPSQGPTSMRGH